MIERAATICTQLCTSSRAAINAGKGQAELFDWPWPHGDTREVLKSVWRQHGHLESHVLIIAPVDLRIHHICRNVCIFVEFAAPKLREVAFIVPS